MKEVSGHTKKRGKKNKISFDNEIISKDQAEKLLAEQGFNLTKSVKQSVDSRNNTEYKIKEKKKKRKQVDEDSGNVEKSKTKKKRKSENQVIENAADTSVSTKHESQEQETTNKPKKESNRAQKRKKHAKLQDEKKLKAELEFQKNALTYLSNWKHCRSEWKFEKLKQVWIQHNLFNTSKIPDEFWETTVDYFSGAKGHSRKLALDEALKIIEKEDENLEENLDDGYQLKLKRARDIVQSLQD